MIRKRAVVSASNNKNHGLEEDRILVPLSTPHAHGLRLDSVKRQWLVGSPIGHRSNIGKMSAGRARGQK